MVGHICISLPAYAEVPIPTVPEQDTYSKAETDELVAEIYIAMRTTYDYDSKRLDEFYYPLNNSICWLNRRTKEMEQDIAMIQEQHALDAGASKSFAAHIQPSNDARIQTSIDARLASFEDRLQAFTYRLDSVYYPLSDGIDSLTTRLDTLQQEMDTIKRQIDFQAEQSPSIDRRTRPSIDSNHTPLRSTLGTEKILQDKLDEITFSQDLLKEDIFQEWKDISESTHAILGMHQRSINNLQNRVHVNQVDKEILKNQWTRGDEAIRSFIGTWFQMSK